MFRIAPSVAAATLLLSAPAMVRAQATDPAAARIAAYNAGTLAIMKQALPTPARIDRFEALVRAHYDMPGIAALVVGPAWSRASAADRQAAIAGLTRHSAVQFARNFVRFRGERFVIAPQVVARDTSRIVRTTIQSPGGGGDTLLYRMRQTGDGWRIVDVISGGVSQLAVQRSDFAATVAGGGVAALVARLRALDGAR